MVFGAVCPFGGPRSSRQERPVGWLNCGEALTPHEVKDTMCWEVCGEGNLLGSESRTGSIVYSVCNECC